MGVAPRQCSLLVLAASALATAVTVRAEAQSLEIQTLASGSWSASVAALQRDRSATGYTVHVVVQDAGGPVACGRYSLHLDAAGAQAFRIEGCDVTTQATALRLVDRSALFVHDDIVPTPRTVVLQAVEVRTAQVESGGAATGGSEVQCTLAVRPYLDNMETGARVFLQPGRFTMHVLDARVSSRAATEGWVLASSEHQTLTVAYEMIDTQRRTTVLRDRAVMTCGSDAAAPVPEPEVASRPEPQAPAPHEHVEVLWSGSWCLAEILSVNGSGRMRIHYTGYGSEWDETVDESRVRRVGSHAPLTPRHAQSEAHEPNYKWVLTEVLGWGMAIPVAAMVASNALGPHCESNCVAGDVDASVSTGLVAVPLIVGSIIVGVQDLAHRPSPARVAVAIAPTERGMGAMVTAVF